MSTTSESTISPPEEDLKAVVASLKKEHPALGIPKLHALLLSENPSWAVSEKRLRRILKNSNPDGPLAPQHQGLEEEEEASTGTPPSRGPAGPSSSPSTTGSKAAHVYPSSTLVEGLDVSRWTTTIEVKYFDKKKGKGLVAKDPISEGQAVWKEDPFIIAPEWEIYDLQIASQACAHCTTPLTNHHLTSLILHCPTTSSTTSSATCPARFCNRLCLKRSEKTHPLLCPAQNPASVPLLTFARKHVWMALHALAQCTARLLLAHQQKQGRQRAGISSRDSEEESLREDWSVYCALADLGMEERVKGGWLHGVEPDRATWQAAHRAFTQAFVAPPDTVQQKKLAKLLKRPLPKEVTDALFTYEGFLHGLGRMSLNLEAHGGLYTLHSHMNHSCSPNVSVRHVDHRTALSRITVIAKRNIAAGEELVVTYVDPSLGVRERRSQLVAWGFGQCECERCVEEEKRSEDEGEGEGETKEQSDMDDLLFSPSHFIEITTTGDRWWCYNKSVTRLPKSKNNSVSKEAGYGAERLVTPNAKGNVPSFLAGTKFSVGYSLKGTAMSCPAEFLDVIQEKAEEKHRETERVHKDFIEILGRSLTIGEFAIFEDSGYIPHLPRILEEANSHAQRLGAASGLTWG